MVWIVVPGYTVRCCCFSYLPIRSSFVFLWKQAGGSLFHVDCNKRPASYSVEDSQQQVSNTTWLPFCIAYRSLICKMLCCLSLHPWCHLLPLSPSAVFLAVSCRPRLLQLTGTGVLCLSLTLPVDHLSIALTLWKENLNIWCLHHSSTQWSAWCGVVLMINSLIKDPGGLFLSTRTSRQFYII